MNFVLCEVSPVSIEESLKGIFSVCESYVYVEISRHEVYLVFAVTETVIQPHIENALTPMILLVILFISSWFWFWLRVSKLEWTLYPQCESVSRDAGMFV